MPNNSAIEQTSYTWRVPFEFDLNASAAITATRGDGITATKTGTGTYTVRVNRQDFVEVLARDVNFYTVVGSPTSRWASITLIDTDGAGDGTGAVITITTWDDNATPAAADTNVAGIISGEVVFRYMKNPFAAIQ